MATHNRHHNAVRRFAAGSFLAVAVGLTSSALGAPPKVEPREPEAPRADKTTCELVTQEAPRGGMLEVKGKNFGKTPVVRIGGKVTRMLERRDDRISVQIPRDSNGGKVTLQSGQTRVECGTLTIIGKNE